MCQLSPFRSEKAASHILYLTQTMSNPIAAISTPPGVGAISCVRLSGPSAIPIADAVFQSKSRLAALPGYTAAPGRIIDGRRTVDQVVALVYRAPDSFTGEDMVEIFCHGSPVVAEKILRLLCQNGAQIAAPGEFTKRAFLNGKLDLTAAAAVADIIAAENDLAIKNAAAMLDGTAHKEITKIAETLTSLLARVDASIDYSDDEELSQMELPADILAQIHARLKTLLDSYDIGKLVAHGVPTAIMGKPNVGKSTIMNLLLGTARSIVTDIAGTTRDVVSEHLRLKNCTLHLRDTAGIRDTDDFVESIGIGKAKQAIETAELVLLVLDASHPLEEDDLSLLEQTKNKNTLIIINKIDLQPDANLVIPGYDPESLLQISATDPAYLPALTSAIEQTLGVNKAAGYPFMLSNERQRALVARALVALENLDLTATADLIAAGLDTALSALLELIGTRVSEAVIDEIFSKFCVGK